MKEKDLIFDRTKHVCYSKAVKKVIQNRLKEHFSKMKQKSFGKSLFAKISEKDGRTWIFLQ